MRSRLSAVAVTVLFTAGCLTSPDLPTPPGLADRLVCGRYETTTLQGRYVVQNDRWGTATAAQCIQVTRTGFRIARADGVASSDGPPNGYPSIYYGCHYGNCSPGTDLPKRISAIRNVTSKVTYTYTAGASYDAAYDIWLDPRPQRDGVNQTEIMIWFNRVGPIQPVGSPEGTATVDGRDWQVWAGDNGMNDVLSFVAPTAITSADIDVMSFLDEAVRRDLASSEWYLTSIQAGFEPWRGGVGLAENSFSATVTD